MGNIVGSSISNILGAFSLGLIFSPKPIVFDRSSKIYCSLLLALTSLFVVLVNFLDKIGKLFGVGLVVIFGVYVASVGWAIYKGIVIPPENDSDSDSEPDSDSDSDEESSVGRDYERVADSPGRFEKRLPVLSKNDPRSSPSSSTRRDFENEISIPLSEIIFEEDENHDTPHPKPKPKHSTLYHIIHLLLGFATLSLSGYLLSHSLTTLAAEFHLSTSFLGITILSLATTLPEKMIAVLSGSRQQGGIMIANTAGSNIFLATLCTGVLFLAGDLHELRNSIESWELGVMWGCAVGLFAIVMFGGRRWMGWMMLACYVGFGVVEILTERGDNL